VVTIVLLAGTALLLHSRNTAEVIPPHQPLESFPHTLTNWSSVDIPMGKDVLDVLGPGDFLLREYQDGTGAPPVGLFVAYFPSQRTGDTIHSPKNCLPGAGWTPLRSERVMIHLPGHAPFLANQYLIALGQEEQLVLYWYWAHDRAVASEYWAKYYLVTDAIRMHRTDGSLIRLTTRIMRGEPIESARERLLALGSLVFSRIQEGNYVPR
jgi:EpsI family protein